MAVELTDKTLAPLALICIIAKNSTQIINVNTVPNFSSVKRKKIPRMTISPTKPAVRAAAKDGRRDEA